MPVIKSAIKKLRKDKNRTAQNASIKKDMERKLNRARKETKDFAVISEAYSAVDKAVKNGLLHKNKAARVKASIAKNTKPAKLSATKKPTKASPKKSASKKATASA